MNLSRPLPLGLLAFALVASTAFARSPATFCNPLNLDYGPYAKGSHGADPVIVPFKGKYYLFDTLDRTGYRVSDDLIHWQTILFDAETAAQAVNQKGEIIAPASYTDGTYLYFVNFGSRNLIRTADPTSGHWELAGVLQNGAGDPDLFLDDDGKLYMVSGLGETSIWEVNRSDLSTVKNTRVTPLPVFKTIDDFVAANHPYGLFYGHKVYNHLNWNKPESLDTTTVDLSARVSGIPTTEGNWMTKYQGRYYFQDSNPDTGCPWYSDSVWVADSIKGPYTLADYSPASMKVGGFINSTGHSCLFQDFHGNWWRVTTMWIGVYAGFERRIGLFPAGFDKQGRMFTDTTLGDYPLVMPDRTRPASWKSPLAGWWVLSKDKACSASSTRDDKHSVQQASDENVRTWWSAKTGDAGEWFQMDLGQSCTVNAVQVNFAEQDGQNKPLVEDYHAYRLLVSTDGEKWTTVVDRSENKTSIPHDYTAFTSPLHIRYLKVVNVHAPRLGKFAIRDLRVFGNAGGKAPAKVAAPTITRGTPAWNVTFDWKPVPGADGYVIRYGVAPDALHLNIQVQGGSTEKLTVSCLNADVKYYYRIDSYNGSGLTVGTPTTTAQ
ncbi:MAG TPA: family 43 glycosylhydrolase [Rariglobus sp.]|jgi:beta-xylosidase|nr:family 43 glycosylhydrolase [Rariglobus sp.]